MRAYAESRSDAMGWFVQWKESAPQREFRLLGTIAAKAMCPEWGHLNFCSARHMLAFGHATGCYDTLGIIMDIGPYTTLQVL